jgi:hypothetical protein
MRLNITRMRSFDRLQPSRCHTPESSVYATPYGRDINEHSKRWVQYPILEPRALPLALVYLQRLKPQHIVLEFHAVA